MAFLDNSGDIILDAVLTDTGRMRLAKGDGSFKITKFVLADDEINYNLYDKNNASGSAYYDLDILQTPVFEAFTNNASVVKHPLLSISRTNLLYLPVMKINDLATSVDEVANPKGTKRYNDSYFIVPVNIATYNSLTSSIPTDTIIHGFDSVNDLIRIDQGLDSTNLTPSFADNGTDLDSFLKETQYIVEIDNRIATIRDYANTPKTPSFIDDDEIASYYFTTSDSTYVSQIKTTSNSNEPLDTAQVILGYRGTSLAFTVKATDQLINSSYLFNLLGSTSTDVGSVNCYYIDVNIVVRGVTTGSSITIPVRFLKKV